MNILASTILNFRFSWPYKQISSNSFIVYVICIFKKKSFQARMFCCFKKRCTKSAGLRIILAAPRVHIERIINSVKYMNTITSVTSIHWCACFFLNKDDPARTDLRSFRTQITFSRPNNSLSNAPTTMFFFLLEFR
jgi:hypothetical protein